MAEQQKPLLDTTQGTKQSSLSGLVMAALERFAIDDDNLIPARVIAYDRVNNLVTVQPQIMWIGMDDVARSRHRIANLSCLSLGGGGFHINFPLNAGDLGWIVAGDRDIALFKQTLAESKPNTHRVHSFADGLFIPDVFRQYTIQGEDSNAMVIQSTDGATRISIRPDNIKITAPSQVEVDTPKTIFTGDVEVQKNLAVTENATVTGATNVNGGFTAASGQACTLPATTTVASKPVNGHTHGGVQPGGSNTNPF